MASIIRGIVSRNKIRYQEDGYDLDLTYILPNIIAMCFPSENLEGVYRNPIEDVIRFLDEKHGSHYFVINLCSERSYDPHKFYGRASCFPFDDHNPPPINLMLPFCQQVDQWLSLHPKNVVAIHCKAGKGRTGTMIAAYLVYKGFVDSADSAINFFGRRRTRDGKGVTIPSQKRYVQYFEHLTRLSRNPQSRYRPTDLLLLAVEIYPCPTLSSLPCTPCMSLEQDGSMFYVSDKCSTTMDSLLLTLPSPVVCTGDIRVNIYNRVTLLPKDEMLHFWFNTFFVPAAQSNSFNQPIQGPQANQPCTGHSCSTDGFSNSEVDGGTASGAGCEMRGSFVSVVKLTNNAQLKSAMTHRSKQTAVTNATHRVLTLNRNEMEVDQRLGPENLQINMFFLTV